MKPYHSLEAVLLDQSRRRVDNRVVGHDLRPVDVLVPVGVRVRALGVDVAEVALAAEFEDE